MSARACEVCGGGEFRHLSSRNGHQFFRCRSCQLIRIDPQPTDETLARIYGKKYYEAWGVQSGQEKVQELKKGTFRKHVMSKVQLQQGARVLDCGAAFGALMEAAKEKGLEPYGIELAAEAAAEIRRRFGPDRIFSGPFEQAAFPGIETSAFDGVFMCDFIEHVRDPLTVLEKASSLLRPGGCLILTTPDGESLSCKLMGSAWLHFKVEHLFYFSRRNMARLLRRLGFNITYSGRAWKVLDLEYIQNQFRTYPRAVVTPMINLLAQCAGSRLRRFPLSFSFGEMIVVGKKP